MKYLVFEVYVNIFLQIIYVLKLKTKYIFNLYYFKTH